MGIRIDRIVLREIRMPLVHFFETSFGRTTARRIVIVEAIADGVSGWGEITCGEHPTYNEEWTESAWLIARDYLAPAILGHGFEERAPSAGTFYTPYSTATSGPLAAAVGDRFSHIRGHRMAQGGVEAAIWDLEARLKGLSLARHIAGPRPAGAGPQPAGGGGAFTEIPCGVSIGIQDSVRDLLQKIETELAAGYQRIKIKIKPGWDFEVVREVRREFPQVPLMADANSAYTLADADHLQRLDEFQLTMVEQPLAHDDIIDHAELQARLSTPVCLDECIRTAHHAEQAIRLGACRVINIKLGRVGGFREAKRVHDVARAHGIPVWCGGMLESGIGRAHNIALSTLPNFVLPGDVSASKRYWARDLIVPEVEVSERGTIRVPEGVGFGYEIDRDFMRRVTVREEAVSQ
jgi:o-succinylbenzoate synthase